jgi:hypothetical protein
MPASRKINFGIAEVEIPFNGMRFVKRIGGRRGTQGGVPCTTA